MKIKAPNRFFPPLLFSVVFAFAGANQTIASTINLGALDKNLALAYSSGDAFRTGNPDIPAFLIGNINHLATQQRGVVKFDISGLSGDEISSAALNFTVNGVGDVDSLYTPPFEIALYWLNLDKGSEAFTAGDVVTPDATYMGSVWVLSSQAFSFDITDYLKSAKDDGLDYISLRFVNLSVDAGPSGAPTYIEIAANESLNLSITAIPELGSTLSVISGAIVMVGYAVLRRGRLS